MQSPLKVGITHGDINGISYEVILKTVIDPEMSQLCTIVLFGSLKLASYYKKMFEMDDINYHICDDLSQIKPGVPNIINITDRELHVDLGQPTAESGQAAVAALDMACQALKNGEIDVLVTAPINKHAIHSDEFPFPGHTEYLQHELGQEGDEVLMLLCNDNLRVATLTTHLPLSKVAEQVKQERVEKTLRLFNQSLKRDFGISRPKIAVLSLNPHAGDSGLLGTEERDEIIPAIKTLNDEGALMFGPFPADGFFGSGAWKKYDGVLSMYHDQGLTPFKTIAGQNGVNFTAGLPFVRTSPDHGTAYDIAGRNIADPTSMRQAIYTAIDIERNRRRLDEASRNPLKKQYEARGADKTIDLSKTQDEETL